MNTKTITYAIDKQLAHDALGALFNPDFNPPAVERVKQEFAAFIRNAAEQLAAAPSAPEQVKQEGLTDLPRLVYEAIGEASMQWEPRPAGTFDSQGASSVCDKLIAEIRALLASQPAVPSKPALKVYKGDICYKSDADDQSFGMWCPAQTHEFPEGTKFYTAPIAVQDDAVRDAALTFEQIEDAFPEFPDGVSNEGIAKVTAPWLHEFARNIERALKSTKPSAAPVEAAPVLGESVDGPNYSLTRDAFFSELTFEMYKADVHSIWYCLQEERVKQAAQGQDGAVAYAFSEHEQGIIADIEAMAANYQSGFWPRALASATLGIIQRLAARPQPQVVAMTYRELNAGIEQGDHHAASFQAGARFAEKHHGIAAIKAAEGEKP